MPTITIDGKTIEAPEGSMLLPVALENGIHIPHYCWHPKLSIDGSCRMCQVEIEGVPKLSVACNTPVRDGMVVHTTSVKVQNTRRGVLELLLVNHPLDCPICDKAGECLLQDYSFAYGSRESKSAEPRRKLEKRKDIGPRMILDQERCILCRRCVRFCREITKTNELGVFNLGERSVLDVLDDKPLANDYSICTADVCPVGALESKAFHHKLRVWFLKKTPSICPGCSNGCNITVDHYRNRVWRLMPRRNDAVNDTWMCDQGRLGYDYVNSEDRLRLPQMRRNGGLESAPWDEALAAVAGRLRDAARAGGIAAIASPHLTNEESLRFSQLLAMCGVTEVAVAVRLGGSDDFLIKAEKAANARGARDMGLDATTVPAILQSVADGLVSTLYVCGSDVLSADPALVERALARVEHLIVQDVAASALTERAEIVLPSLTFAEKTGTFTNGAGRVQTMQQAIQPPDGQPCDGEIFSQLMGVLGEGQRAFDPRQVLADEIAASVPGYAGLTADTVGNLGAQVIHAEGTQS